MNRLAGTASIVTADAQASAATSQRGAPPGSNAASFVGRDHPMIGRGRTAV
jgi:hypothetical protein